MKGIKRLSDAEFEIMQIIWENNPPITTTVLMECIKDIKSWKLSTLSTVLKRLLEKGFLTSVKTGKERLFYPIISREEYITYETRLFFSKFHNNSLNSFLNKLDKNSIDVRNLENILLSFKDLK